MPVIAVLSLLIQVAFAVHAIRTGRGYSWVLLILMFPLVGCLIYLFVAVLPDIGDSPAARRASSTLRNTIDPNRNLRNHSRDLKISDTVENRLKLAGELVKKGDFAGAASLYEKCLNGVFEHDPVVMLGLAQAHFGMEKYDQVKETLEKLIAENPDFKSQEGHLLYARTLEALGETDAAVDEYRVLADYYSGAEAKCRYAVLLQRVGRQEEAQQLFRDILFIAKNSSKHYRRLQAEWIKVAREQLA